jgi:hypothetical protein
MTYAEWIADYVTRHKGYVRGLCISACAEMRAAFPELTEVRGWANNDEHAWLVAPDGAVVDPTVSQFVGWGTIAYRPFKPGDTVRVGRCHQCGDAIFARVERLDDPAHARSTCNPCSGIPYVECYDCGCDLSGCTGADKEAEPRCDTCRDHHAGLCGSDCPINEHLTSEKSS